MPAFMRPYVIIECPDLARAHESARREFFACLAECRHWHRNETLGGVAVAGVFPGTAAHLEQSGDLARTGDKGSLEGCLFLDTEGLDAAARLSQARIAMGVKKDASVILIATHANAAALRPADGLYILVRDGTAPLDRLYRLIAAYGNGVRGKRLQALTATPL